MCLDSRRLAIAQGHALTLITSLHYARGTQLKRRYENAPFYFRDLKREQAGHFSRGLNYLLNEWVERFGPAQDCVVRVPEHTVEEMRGDGRRRYEDDIGAGYVLEFLS